MESPKFATRIRDVSVQNQASGKQVLYRLSPPLDEHEFVVSSAIAFAFDTAMSETYLFAASHDGDITDWSELDGSQRGISDPDAAIRNAGYTIIDDGAVVITESAPRKEIES